jgi:hypothetical protein
MELSACYAACGAAWVSCYAASGLIAGTIIASPLAPVAAMSCNALESQCMIACTGASAAAWCWNPYMLALIGGLAALATNSMRAKHAVVPSSPRSSL